MLPIYAFAHPIFMGMVGLVFLPLVSIVYVLNVTSVITASTMVESFLTTVGTFLLPILCFDTTGYPSTSADQTALKFIGAHYPLIPISESLWHPLVQKFISRIVISSPVFAVVYISREKAWYPWTRTTFTPICSTGPMWKIQTAMSVGTIGDHHLVPPSSHSVKDKEFTWC